MNSEPWDCHVLKTLPLPKRQWETRKDDPTRKRRVYIKVNGIIHCWTPVAEGKWVTPCGHHLRIGLLATRHPSEDDLNCPVCEQFGQTERLG